jgi:predicted GTPase
MAPMRNRAERFECASAALDRCVALCPRDDDPSVTLRVEVLRAGLHLGATARVAVIARRGAGKSTLLNALANRALARVGHVADATLDARTWSIETRDARLLWLDTPGLRAGGRSERLDVVRRAVRAFEPTCALFLCAATEVDAGIDDDLDDLGAILGGLRAETPLIAAVTRVDELPPFDVVAPPFDDEKRAYIQQATITLHRHLLRRALVPRAVMPLCAFASWEGDALTDDARWNLAPLTRALAHTTPRDPAEALERLLRGLCAELVDRVAIDAERAITRAEGARGPAIVRARLDALVGTLDALLDAFTERGGATLAETLGSVAKPGALFGLVRGALDGVGARRAAASLAATRVRAVGRAVLTLESFRPSAEVVAMVGRTPRDR